MGTYVMDIGLLSKPNDDNTNEKKENDESFEVILIEMTPFSLTAGGSLFEWEKDVKILTNIKSKSICFRIREECLKSIPESFNPALLELEQKLMKEFINSQN